MHKLSTPPKWPLKLLQNLLKSTYLEEIEGDLTERFQENVEKHPIKKARRIFILDCMKLIHPYLMKSPGGDRQLNRYGMFRSNFLLTVRTLQRRKTYSLTSIIGLSVGLACFYSVFSWWQYLNNYDNFHQDINQIHSIQLRGKSGNKEIHGLCAPLLAGEMLQKSFPSVEASTYTANFFEQKKIKVSYRERSFFEEGTIITSDSGFFSVFDFPIVKGKKKTALTGPNKVIVSEQAAAKIYGTTDPIGLPLEIDNNTYHVSAVVNVPVNSQVQFDYVLSGASFPSNHRRFQWSDLSFPVYLRLKDGAPSDKIAESLYENLVDQSGIPEMEQIARSSGLTFSLLPFQQIKYVHDFTYPPLALQSSGFTKDLYLYLLLAAGIIILVIASLNFANLSLVQVEKDKKAILIFGLFGRGYHIGRGFIESLIIYVIATTIAVVITYLALAQWGNLPADFLSYLLQPENVVSLLAIAFLLGSLTALGTAIAKAKLTGAFNGVVRPVVRRPITLRAGLVVFQFSISILLLLAAVFVFQQFTLMLKQDVGFKKDQIIFIEDIHPLEEKAVILKEQVLQHSAILSASLSDYIPSQNIGNNNPLTVPGTSEQYLFAHVVADSSFLEVYQVPDKNTLSGEYKTNWCIINQEAQKAIQKEGKIPLELLVNGVRYHIKSVIDPLFEPLHFAPRPMVIVPFANNNWSQKKLSIRFSGKHAAEALKALEDEWASLTDFPLEYKFLDQSFANLYRNEQMISQVLFLFSWVATITSLMGLLAIVLSMIGMRTKEIAIRKTVGAQVENILVLLATTFSKWLLISMGLAIPIAYIVLTRWAENFVVRASFDPFIILGVIFGVYLGALLTVAFHTIKAANANPVEYLRND